MPTLEKMTLEENLETLRQNVSALPAKDQNFALSLLQQASRRMPSDKQAHWIGVLADRATGKEAAPERERVDIGSMIGILALFDKAAKHLSRPAIVLEAPQGEIRLSLAGPSARVPGSINVTEYQRGGSDRPAWFGRILRTGQFEKTPRDHVPESLPAYLARFAADPEGEAAKHGRLTGRCCFCNRGLTDERSTAVGYGPICAGNFGLEWGARA